MRSPELQLRLHSMITPIAPGARDDVHTAR